jgi:hypothetical protein
VSPALLAYGAISSSRGAERRLAMATATKKVRTAKVGLLQHVAPSLRRSSSLPIKTTAATTTGRSLTAVAKPSLTRIASPRRSTRSAPHATYTREPVGAPWTTRVQRAPDGSRMMSRHLSCAACRVRLRASAPEIAVLEGRCPICGATLTPVSSAAGVVGLRSFDLDALSQSDDQRGPPGNPVDLATRRSAASASDDLDADGWSDDGGTTGAVNSAAVAKWPTAQ